MEVLNRRSRSRKVYNFAILVLPSEKMFRSG